MKAPTGYRVKKNRARPDLMWSYQKKSKDGTIYTALTMNSGKTFTAMVEKHQFMKYEETFPSADEAIEALNNYDQEKT